MDDSILLLAPRSSSTPRVLDEVERILQTGVAVTPLIGNTTYEQVLDIVSTKDHSIFWYSGHFSSDGIDLEDEKISIGLLASLLRGRFRLIVLNTCQSQELAKTLFGESKVMVVGTISEVPDLEAFQSGVLFLRAYLRTHNVEQAYHQVRTASYILLSQEVKVSHSMDELTRALNDLRTELYSVKTQIAVLNQRVETLEATITMMVDSKPNTLSQVMVGAIIFLLLVLCVLVGILVSRGIG